MFCSIWCTETNKDIELLPESIYFPELSPDHLRGKTIYVMLQDKCISDVTSVTSILSIENKSIYFPPQRETDGSNLERQSLLTFYFKRKKGKNCFHFNWTKKKSFWLNFTENFGEEKVRDLQDPEENDSLSEILREIKIFRYHHRGGWSFTNKDKVTNLSPYRHGKMSSNKILLGRGRTAETCVSTFLFYQWKWRSKKIFFLFRNSLVF